MKRVVVSKRQYNALMRISKKAEAKKLLSRKGSVDIESNIYRGYEIVTQEQARRPRKKDTLDIGELIGEE